MVRAEAALLVQGRLSAYAEASMAAIVQDRTRTVGAAPARDPVTGANDQTVVGMAVHQVDLESGVRHGLPAVQPELGKSCTPYDVGHIDSTVH